MAPDELRTSLANLGVSQADFGRLIDTTSRGVALWLSGARTIPGPVEAYVRLLNSLPLALRQAELARIKNGLISMKNGMYSLAFRSGGTEGIGLLTFEDGTIYGVDAMGVLFDGSYAANDSGSVDATVKVTYPPGVVSVFGVSNPYSWAIDFNLKLDPTVDVGRVALKTPTNHVIDVEYRFMRALPQAA
jgi:hypothetical protein